MSRKNTYNRILSKVHFTENPTVNLLIAVLIQAKYDSITDITGLNPEQRKLHDNAEKWLKSEYGNTITKFCADYIIKSEVEK